MKHRYRLALLVGLTGLAVALTPAHADAPPATPADRPASNYTPPPLPAATTTSTTSAPQLMTRCPAYQPVALAVGFTAAHLPTLDRIINRESRCDPTQLNAADPNGGSVGLTQINRFWCLPSRYYPAGYLQHVGVLNDCDQLYEPAVNLAAALALVEYSLDVGLCGWAQWWWVEAPCDDLPATP